MTDAAPVIWIAPSEMDTENATLEKRSWDAADQYWLLPCLLSEQIENLVCSTE